MVSIGEIIDDSFSTGSVESEQAVASNRVVQIIASDVCALISPDINDAFLHRTQNSVA